jgi:hypothetical protein
MKGRSLRSLIPGLLLGGAGPCPACAEQPAADLQARYVSLQTQLNHNAFQRQLFLDSTEGAEQLKGDIYAVVDHAYATVSQALQEMDNWCDILILHLNVKSCRAAGTAGAQTLNVSIGRKSDEPLDRAFPVSFDYRVAAAGSDFLRILLRADTGPLGSRNYVIALEAVPLKDGRTFIHLSYSYDQGLASRLAMKSYLATLGRDKVGFSVINRPSDGEAMLISGVRGVVERNTMRYYLAIDTYLGSLSTPPAEQLEKRLHDWFAATERFPLQLHELNENDYIAMKRNEVRRQQSGVGKKPPNGAGSMQ